MKTSMFFLILFMAVQAVQCRHKPKSYPNEVNAVILRADYRKCMCCGGLVIQIDGTEYLFGTFPADVDFNIENEQLPLPVTLSYEPEPCPSAARIKVLTMHKI